MLGYCNDEGISLHNFYKWNPAINTDCSGLLANLYVCFGIAGSAQPATIAVKSALPQFTVLCPWSPGHVRTSLCKHSFSHTPSAVIGEGRH